MKIEKLTKSDIQNMSDPELHEQRETFVQMYDKLWRGDCWPGIPRGAFIAKYADLCKAMDSRGLNLKPRGIDVSLLRTSLLNIVKYGHDSDEAGAPPVHVKLIKSDSPQRIVYGIVAEPNETDTDGDFQTVEDIEKAAYHYMEHSQRMRVSTDINHDNDDFGAVLLENFLAPTDIAIEGEIIKKGSWVQALRLDEDTWKKVESGELTGFSMAGTAIRVETG